MVDPSVRVYVASAIATGFVVVNNIKMAYKKVIEIYAIAKDTICEISALQDEVIETFTESSDDAEELAVLPETLVTNAKQEIARGATVVKIDVAATTADAQAAISKAPPKLTKLEAKIKRRLGEELNHRVAGIQDQIMSKMQMQRSSAWKVSLPLGYRRCQVRDLRQPMRYLTFSLVFTLWRVAQRICGTALPNLDSRRSK